MKSMKIVGVMVISLSASFGQFSGDFYYHIKPRTAEPGDTVKFQAFQWNSCLYNYDVSYTLEPTPISSIKTTIVNINAKRKPSCALAVGFSGPSLELKLNEVGRYKIQFNDSSDFKEDLGDTNYFDIRMTSNRLKSVPIQGVYPTVSMWYNLLGQLMNAKTQEDGTQIQKQH